MKIQVGKTYKDGWGREWYIEACLHDGVHKGWFIGTSSASDILCHFSSEGRSDINIAEFDLLPNRVKKESWGYMFSTQSYTIFTRESRKDAEDAASTCAGAVLVKSIWYEDEE